MSDRKAVASTSLRAVLTGPGRPGTVLGGSAHAVWVAVDGGVVAVTSRHAVRLPNAIAIAADDVGAARPGDPARVGRGGVMLPRLAAAVVRWWEPSPRLPALETATRRRRTRAIFADVPPLADNGLGEALAAGDRTAAQVAAEDLVGEGDGLTPLGDDVLAGALAALVLLGATDLAGAMAVPVAAARHRTTALSATLLRHAARGEVAAPVGRLLLGLCGRGDGAAALAALLAVGHTSGRGLAHGVRIGAAAA